jgi:hypothetical protein
MDEKQQVNAAPAEISRRRVLAAGALGVVGLVLPIAVGRAADASGLFVYVGSYTKNPPGGGSNNPIGLSVFRFDPAAEERFGRGLCDRPEHRDDQPAQSPVPQ